MSAERCPRCAIQEEHWQRWNDVKVACIRRVLECHLLGAEVIALKDAKTERLAAIHALQALDVLREELMLRHAEATTEERGDR